MERELLCFSLFLLTALAGVARFREHPLWNRVSQGIANGTLLLGTVLLLATMLEKQLAHLVPLSLLGIMYVSSFRQSNFAAQMIVLPLVIGELLLSILFSEIRELFATLPALLVAAFFHVSFYWFVLKISDPFPKVRTWQFQYPPTHFFFHTDRRVTAVDRGAPLNDPLKV